MLLSVSRVHFMSASSLSRMPASRRLSTGMKLRGSWLRPRLVSTRTKGMLNYVCVLRGSNGETSADAMSASYTSKPDLLETLLYVCFTRGKQYIPTGQKCQFAFLFTCGLLNYWAKTVKLHLAIMLALQLAHWLFCLLHGIPPSRGPLAILFGQLLTQ